MELNKENMLELIRNADAHVSYDELCRAFGGSYKDVFEVLGELRLENKVCVYQENYVFFVKTN